MAKKFEFIEQQSKDYFLSLTKDIRDIISDEDVLSQMDLELKVEEKLLKLESAYTVQIERLYKELRRYH